MGRDGPELDPPESTNPATGLDMSIVVKPQQPPPPVRGESLFSKLTYLSNKSFNL